MLHVERGGDGPLLVLLHGLGATGEVWREVVPYWSGSWLVPDLPGHGRSGRLERYSFGAIAAAVAEVIPRESVAIVGHSLGGVVGLTLSTGWYGVDVTSVIGLGVKVRWAGEELAKIASLADRPAKVFATREEAVERASKLAGVPLQSGVQAVEGGWAVSLDTQAFKVGAPDLPGLLASTKAQVVLGSSEGDPLSPPSHLAELVPEPVVFPGTSHNVHVDSPTELLPLLARLR